MIYEDAEAKYAFIQKAINKVLEDAYAVVYKGSLPIDDASGSTGDIFAVNTIHNYPRQAVISLPLAAHVAARDSSVQVSKDGKTGFLLIEAKAGQSQLAVSKGLYADIERVTGRLVLKTELNVQSNNSDQRPSWWRMVLSPSKSKAAGLPASRTSSLST